MNSFQRKFDDAWVDTINLAKFGNSPQVARVYPIYAVDPLLNGPEIPTAHGAPVRLRVARQLGYKSIKYLSRVTVTDSLKPFGKGVGGINAEEGYSWWAGI